MDYKFPLIENLNQVLNAINGYDEFIVAKNEQASSITVNYVFNTPNTFSHPNEFESQEEKTNAAIRRECRGIEFDLATEKLVTRKFQKFFNANEKPETMVNTIDWSHKHWILEKADGSLASPYYNPNTELVEYHTKMGRTQVAEPINKFVDKSKIDYNKFFVACRISGITPLYEWCSRQQKIVIDYPEENLVLTAIRNNITGEYIDYDDMKYMASIYDVPVITAYEGLNLKSNNLLKYVQEMNNAEGVIVRFESGHMIKIKSSWYSKLHNSIDLVKFEKNIVDVLINDLMDDLRPSLIDTTREPMERFAVDFYNNISKEAKRLNELFEHVKANHDRKSFALEVAPMLDKSDVPLIFRIWQGDDAISVIKSLIKKNYSSQNAVDGVRKYFGNIRWMDYYNNQIENDDG
jgi:T4 RnlA family RNA ligase